MNNWLLISSISLALKELEEKHSWSLMTEEHSSFLESIYNQINTNGLPKNKKEIKKIVLEASKKTYKGYDPSVESFNVEEMITLMSNLTPYIREKNKISLSESHDLIREIILS